MVISCLHKQPKARTCVKKHPCRWQRTTRLHVCALAAQRRSFQTWCRVCTVYRITVNSNNLQFFCNLINCTHELNRLLIVSCWLQFISVHYPHVGRKSAWRVRTQILRWYTVQSTITSTRPNPQCWRRHTLHYACFSRTCHFGFLIVHWYPSFTGLM